MKAIFHLGLLGLGLATACPGRAAEDAPESLVVIVRPPAATPQTALETPARPPRSRMQEQLANLVRNDARSLALARPTEADIADAGADLALELEPMTVNGEKVTIPPAVHEAPVREILRTGTIWQKAGPRFTRSFWIKGDEGIGFSLSW